MRIEKSYHMSEDVFIRIYRAHCHIKFHIRRSMILSFLLLTVGLVMEYVYHKDYGSLNRIVLILFLISVLCNYACDYRIPRTAYHGMYDNSEELSKLVIQDDGIKSGVGEGAESELYFRSWEQFDKCYETADAFLLYQRDMFTMIWKELCGDQLNEVRALLQDKVNKGKPIPMKK